MGRPRSVLVVVGSFCNLFLSAGFIQSVGLFVVEWQEEFEDKSAEEIGWIFSFFMIGYAISGEYNTS